MGACHSCLQRVHRSRLARELAAQPRLLRAQLRQQRGHLPHAAAWSAASSSACMSCLPEASRVARGNPGNATHDAPCDWPARSAFTLGVSSREECWAGKPSAGHACRGWARQACAWRTASASAGGWLSARASRCASCCGAPRRMSAGLPAITPWLGCALRLSSSCAGTAALPCGDPAAAALHARCGWSLGAAHVMSER